MSFAGGVVQSRSELDRQILALLRWTRLFTGPFLVGRFLSDARGKISDAELAKVQELAALYRAPLYDLSWFMRTP